jgi:hypothetical protein
MSGGKQRRLTESGCASVELTNADLRDTGKRNLEKAKPF